MSEKIVYQLQLLQKNLESLVQNKGLLQEQLFEIDTALKNLPGSQKSYKIIGKLLVEKSVTDLQTNLLSDKKNIDLQIKEIEVQEKAITKKQRLLQEKLVNN